MEGLGEKIQELLHHLEPAPLFSGGDRIIAGQDIGPTNYIFFLLIGVIITIIFFVLVRSSVMKSRRTDLVPTGIGNVGEMGYSFVRDNIVLDVMGEEGKKYTPFVATIFFAVLFQNFLGLIPGFKPGTGTLGVTFTWGIIVFIWVTVVGFQKNGLGFFKSFLPSGTPLFLAPFIYVLELISYFLRPFTLGVRLYANMYAGHIVLGVFAIFVEMALHNITLTSAVVGSLAWIMQIVMYAFEVFVAFIQAYVFAILTAVYIGMSLHASEH